ncbi:MAG TPA: glycosyltransferase [bacterium]|nr:glycosyltransferase [bacterium]HPL83698.1 glycosyltransferase [bacterium]
MKQPLIANFSQKDQSLVYELLTTWADGRSVLWSIDGPLTHYWSAQTWPLYLITHKTNPNPCWIGLTLPWRKLSMRRRLAKFVNQYSLDGLICLSWLDKLLLTGPARRLGLPVVWLELPEDAKLSLPSWLLQYYHRQANKVKIITFGRHLVDHLHLQGQSLNNCHLLLPAIDPKLHLNQTNLFSNLALNKQEQSDKPYFVIGAVVDLTITRPTEILLRSLKIILSVIPSVQLVIIGDGPKRKELQGLARELDLANLAWFVGRQEPLDKWLYSLNGIIELETGESQAWQRLLQAMLVGLPIIVPKSPLTADFLLPGETALVVERAEPEMLAQAVIQLQQDKLLAGRLAWRSKEWMNEFGLIDRQLNDFVHYISEIWDN